MNLLFLIREENKEGGGNDHVGVGIDRLGVGNVEGDE